MIPTFAELTCSLFLQHCKSLPCPPGVTDENRIIFEREMRSGEQAWLCKQTSDFRLCRFFLNSSSPPDAYICDRRQVFPTSFGFDVANASFRQHIQSAGQAVRHFTRRLDCSKFGHLAPSPWRFAAGCSPLRRRLAAKNNCSHFHRLDWGLG